MQSAKRGEWYAARLAHAACFCAIDENLEDPSFQGRAALESLDSLQYSDPGILSDLFSDRPVIHKRLGEAHQGAMMATDQFQKGRFVAVS